MKIVIDSKTNELKVGSQIFGSNMQKDKENEVVSILNNFLVKNTDISSYDEDSMWMSYRYCIGRHTIAASMRAGDIAAHCYGRMSEERSIFTAFDINREIERVLQFGNGPMWHFPLTSMNRIYTSALDIFCQFVEDFNITDKLQLLDYRNVYIKLSDNERGYSIETETWDEWKQAEFTKLCQRHNLSYNSEEDADIESLKSIEDFARFYKALDEHKQAYDHFYLNDIDDLMVWNNLVHLFDLEHHHKSILVNGEEVEWYWTYTHDTYQKEDDPDHYYIKEIGYKRIRVPIDSRIGSGTRYIPDESIKKDLY